MGGEDDFEDDEPEANQFELAEVNEVEANDSDLPPHFRQLTAQFNAAGFSADSPDDIRIFARHMEAQGDMVAAGALAARAFELEAEQDAAKPAVWEAEETLVKALPEDMAQELVDSWGADFADRLVRAENVIENMGQGDAFLAAVRRNDARMVFSLLTVADRFAVENGIQGDRSGYSHEPAPATGDEFDKLQIQREIDRLWQLGPAGSDERRRVQNRLDYLFGRLHGEGEIVGKGGRVL
jgi:hypothetical protein